MISVKDAEFERQSRETLALIFNNQPQRQPFFDQARARLGLLQTDDLFVIIQKLSRSQQAVANDFDGPTDLTGYRFKFLWAP